MYDRSGGLITIPPSARRLVIGMPLFLGLVFIVSWAGAGPMVLASWGEGRPEVLALARRLAPLQPLMFFGTLLVTLFVVAVNHGLRGLADLGRGLLRVGVSTRWYALALFGPMALMLAGALGARAMDESLAPFSLSPDILATTAMIFVGYLALNTEEIAWRGYVLPRLQARHSVIRANLILATIWTLFHLPLFLMEGGHPAGNSLLVFVPMVFAMTFIASVVFNGTGGSILIAHLLHQSFNAWGEGLRIFPIMNGGSGWPFGLTIALMLPLGVIAAFWLARR